MMDVSSINNLAKSVLDIEAKSILRLKDNIGEEFDKAIDILYNCKGRVIITGMGKSGLIGRKIAATLTSTGTPSYFLHPAESTHGDSGIITRNDVVIAISNSGETQELLNLLPLIKRFGVTMIGMTGNLNSTLAHSSDVTLDISVEKEACPLNKAPTASTTATLAMGDALAVCLLEKRGFTKEDFLILGVGELSHRKNHQIIIKALGEAKIPNSVFMICGNAMNSANTKDELEKLAKQENVDLRLMGLRKDIPEICKCADIGVMPSTREGLGLSGIEMLASGLPVVASDVHGIVDYIINNEDGYLCNPYDYREFSGAIKKALKTKDVMKKKCKKYAKPFDKKYANEKMKEIYQKILG